jgi:hypothetical protein
MPSEWPSLPQSRSNLACSTATRSGLGSSETCCLTPRQPRSDPATVIAPGSAGGGTLGCGPFRPDKASEAAIFGPRVAAMQAVDAAARMGDPETALRLARRVPAAAGDEVPAFWEAGHRLHLAHAALELRQDREALEYLAQGRDLAPDWVQYQPLGASTMRSLIDRAPRRPGARFATVAGHYGYRLEHH